MTIFKFEIPDGAFLFNMPRGAKILTVEYQSATGRPMLWALVDQEQPHEPRKFFLAETGRSLPNEINDAAYVGTFQYPDSRAFHLFETVRPEEPNRGREPNWNVTLFDAPVPEIQIGDRKDDWVVNRIEAKFPDFMPIDALGADRENFYESWMIGRFESREGRGIFCRSSGRQWRWFTEPSWRAYTRPPRLIRVTASDTVSGHVLAAFEGATTHDIATQIESSKLACEPTAMLELGIELGRMGLR